MCFENNLTFSDRVVRLYFDETTECYDGACYRGGIPVPVSRVWDEERMGPVHSFYNEHVLQRADYVVSYDAATRKWTIVVNTQRGNLTASHSGY